MNRSPNASPTKAQHESSPVVEYGIRYRWANGEEFDSGPASLAFCRLTVEAQSSAKADWNPRAVAVVRRRTSAWEVVDDAAEPVAAVGGSR